MSKSATSIFTEIRNGELIREASEALAEALQSVQEVGKDASVTIKIGISQLTKMKLQEPAIGYTGEVIVKLAKPDATETIFFIDANGDPTRTPSKQGGLDLSIASSTPAKAG